MDIQSITSTLSLLLLIALSAFFSAAETSFSSINRIRMKNMSESGSKRASLVLNLHDDYDRLLSTILVGNTITTLSAASVCAVLFIKRFGSIGATVSTVAITVSVLVFAEITPKSLAKESPEKTALFCAPLLYLLIMILTPVNWIFAQWKRLLNAIVETPPDDRAMTEQELLIMVEEAEQDGAINEEDKQLIHNAIEFNDMKAEDILTPRMNIVGMPKGLSTDAMAELFLKTGYSRIPIYDESVDNIIGMVHLRDFFDCMFNREKSIDSIISPAVFVAPSVRISDLLKLLQKEKSHMAVVTDEYGGTAGIVTMEDILEELVGEIWDESDEIIEEFIPLEDGRYKVVCSADIDKMFDLFGLTGEPDTLTVSGWIMNMLGKIPEEGDSFAYMNIAVTVSKVEHRRALECVVTVEPASSFPPQ